jgi:catechol 2,3-dioxygenase
VSSLDRAVAFYGDLLGLRQERKDGRALMRAAGDNVALLELIEHPGAKPQPVPATGLFHTAFLLPRRSDLALALSRLTAARYPLQGASDHAVSEALYLADPDGNGVEIYADRPRESWTRANGEIVMTTMRLNLESLLAEVDAVAGNDQWDGFPGGTVVGHIHLRVASIDRSRALLSEIIGFDIIVSRYPGAIFVSAGGYHHHVAANVWEGSNFPPLPGDAAGLIDFEIVVPDAEEIAAIGKRARTAGVHVESLAHGLAIGQDGIRVRIVEDQQQ